MDLILYIKDHQILINSMISYYSNRHIFNNTEYKSRRERAHLLSSHQFPSFILLAFSRLPLCAELDLELDNNREGSC